MTITKKSLATKEMYRLAYELCEDAAMARRMVAQIKKQQQKPKEGAR